MASQTTQFEWSFDEYDMPNRGTLWYVAAGLVIGALLVYSLTTQNYTFPILIIMAMVVVFSRSFVQPHKVSCRITTQGIEVGERMYPLTDLSTFWFIDTATGKKVYIQKATGLQDIVGVPLMDQDEEQVRQFLLDYIDESFEYVNEPAGERLVRSLKL